MGYFNYEFADEKMSVKSAVTSPNIIFDVVSLKVKKLLNIACINPEQVDFLMPKLDLSQTAEIVVHLNYQITLELMLQLFQPSVKKLILHMPPINDVDVNPALLALQKCPNLINISVSYSTSEPIINDESLKQILRLPKRKNKLKGCYFSPASILEPGNLMTFLNFYLAENAAMMIPYSRDDQQTFLNMANYIEMVTNIRLQQNIGMTRLCLTCDGFSSYQNKRLYF